jgi:hypothetical protein
MLNNPKWDVMTLDSFISWLRLQPADASYNWQFPESCLMGQYLTDKIGHLPSSETYHDMPHYRDIAVQRPWTFGGALKRAEFFKNHG